MERGDDTDRSVGWRHRQSHVLVIDRIVRLISTSHRDGTQETV